MKSELREKMLTIRDSLTTEEVTEKSLQIKDRLISTSMYTEANHIFTFLSFNKEVMTKPIIDDCMKKNKQLYIPLCNTQIKEIVLCKFEGWDKLKPSKFGIMEPVKDHIRIVNRCILDMAIVPGAVFDRRGNRIGYGAGYYDKFFNTLTKNILKIAVCYSFQVVDSITPSEYDVPMDYIVTENEIITCEQYR
ncbi:MAG: 5-formyltetrahydrofolate cyclo-ligase [Lutispora sp.]|jgi:5-formyltetrahydrofolate cyclo-ligase